MQRGRPVDNQPRKILIPILGKEQVTRHEDGSMTIIFPFNDSEGIRRQQPVTLKLNDEMKIQTG